MSTHISTVDAMWPLTSGGGSMSIEEDGTLLPARTTLNFGSGLTAVDNPILSRIDITGEPGPQGPPGNAGSVNIEEDGTVLAARSALNFASGIQATDNPGADRIDITVAAAGSSTLTPEQFGAVGNVTTLTDGATTSGSGVVTSATGSFTQSDVGKRISIGGASTGPDNLHTTILSVQSATQLTMATNAGVSLTNATFSYATDDTAAVQAAITAAGSGRTTVLLSKMYATTAELNVPAACNIVGTGAFGKFGNFGSGTLPSGAGVGVPWTAPYLEGAGLHVMQSGLRSALAITAEATEANLLDFGIRFAAPMFNTGHGIYAHPGASKNGVANATWRNVKVFGHDGNSYAFYLGNFFHCQLSHLRGWGGGLVQMVQDNGLWAYGNSVFLDVTGKSIVGGSANIWNVIKQSGAFSQIALIHPGMNAVVASKYGWATFNGRALTPMSGAQKFCNIPQDAIQGLMILNLSFDQGGSTIGATPTLPQAAAGLVGQFIDPSGWGLSFVDHKMMIAGSNASNVIVPGTINGTYENLGTGLITSAVKYDFESAAAGSIVRTLPALSASRGVEVTVKKTDSGGNTVTVSGAGTDKIDGAGAPGTKVLSTQGQTATFIGGITSWYTF